MDGLFSAKHHTSNIIKTEWFIFKKHTQEIHIYYIILTYICIY